ncbi:phosphatase PAP2 family protein [Demequina sp. SO4-13]|uniref:phosphatase PAP2 family protein n=1 Tax=Demequina sp. SO4-13 TaxID=3401027 RepID=UPI003AF9767C
MPHPDETPPPHPIDARPPSEPDALVSAHVDDADMSLAGGHRFTRLAALGLAAVLAGAVPFLVLMTLVQAEWAPLVRLDVEVAEGLNEVANESPILVTVLEYITEIGGGATAAYVLGVTAAFMLVRRQYRLAAYLAVTGLGLAVLAPVTKAYVDRVRPDVALPVSELPTNASFPSGHAMTATVVWGAVALVALSVIRPSHRPALVIGTVVFILLTGFTRLALGVHFVSDVVAGWALGALWLAITTATFRRWLRYRNEPREPGLGEQPTLGLRAAPVKESILPQGRRSIMQLAVAGLIIAIVIAGAGIAAFGSSAGNAVMEWDTRVTQSVLDSRTPERVDAAHAVAGLSGTWGIVAVAITGIIMGLAFRGSWRPAVFVIVAVVGELVLYLITSQAVGRARPLDNDYTSSLPQGGSFPSGHVAAAVASYGALCALAITYLHSRWRWLAVAPVVVIVTAIMVARVMLGAHHVLDVLGGLLLGVLWLFAVVRVLLSPPYAAVPERRP